MRDEEDAFIHPSSLRPHPFVSRFEAQHGLRAVVGLDLKAAAFRGRLMAEALDAADGVRQVARPGRLAAEHDLDARRVLAVRLEVQPRERQPVLDPEVLLDAVLHADYAEPRPTRAVPLAELPEERAPARLLDLSRHAPLRSDPSVLLKAFCLYPTLRPACQCRRPGVKGRARCAAALLRPSRFEVEGRAHLADLFAAAVLDGLAGELRE